MHFPPHNEEHTFVSHKKKGDKTFIKEQAYNCRRGKLLPLLAMKEELVGFI